MTGALCANKAGDRKQNYGWCTAANKKDRITVKQG